MGTRVILLMWVFASALLLAQNDAFCFKNHLENRAIEIWVCMNGDGSKRRHHQQLCQVVTVKLLMLDSHSITGCSLICLV
jgi:hypothetical protein